MFETLMALVISLVFVFLGGLLTGFAARLLMPITLNNVFIHSRLWLPELVVFALGAITLVTSFARSEDKPFLPSIIIAYAFFLPISASAFGISSGLPNVWLQGLLVFLTHFALTSTIGLITLLILRLRPTSGGIILSLIMLAVFAGILIFLIGSGVPATQTDTIPQSTPTNSTQPTPLSPTSELSAAPEPSATPLVQAATRTPTADNITPSPVPLTLEITLPPTETPTITLTIQPTPVYGKVQANEGGGANLRDVPGGVYIMTLLNGTIVETYSEFQLLNGITWVKVFAQVNGQRIEGWLLESVISYATPAPNFQASPTPRTTFTPTLTVTP